MPPAARVLDIVSHSLPPALAPGRGSVTTLIGSLPVWRGMPLAANASPVPVLPHGSVPVLINFGLGGPDRIAKGEPTVLVGG